jgi:hypothetical protein
VLLLPGCLLGRNSPVAWTEASIVAAAEGDPDATGDDDVSGSGDTVAVGDANASSCVVGSLTITAPEAGSPLEVSDLAVDWTAGLAYVTTVTGETCFLVIDIADPLNPSVLRTVGTDTTPASLGGSCTGVEVFNDGTRLFVSGAGVSLLEVWSSRNDPRGSVFSRVGSEAMAQPRRMALSQVGVDAWTAFVASATGVSSFALLDVPGSASASLAPRDEFVGACDHNDVVLGADGITVTACAVDGAAIEVLDEATLNVTTSFSLEREGNPASAIWCGAASSDGRRLFQGGCVSGFLEILPGPPPSVTMSLRVDNPGCYRDAVFVDDEGKAWVYAVSDDGHLDVWDATTAEPVLVRRGYFPGANGGLAGVEVSAALHRAVVVSRDGDLLLVDTATLPAAESQYEIF